MANILVTGSDGQLGREIAELTKKRASSDCYYFTDAAELDITDALAVETFVEKNSIDLIINCAAYNKVGEAEKQMEELQLALCMLNSFDSEEFMEKLFEEEE